MDTLRYINGQCYKCLFLMRILLLPGINANVGISRGILLKDYLFLQLSDYELSKSELLLAFRGPKIWTQDMCMQMP